MSRTDYTGGRYGEGKWLVTDKLLQSREAVVSMHTTEQAHTTVWYIWRSQRGQEERAGPTNDDQGQYGIKR